jgi:chemotaxis protein CheC
LNIGFQATDGEHESTDLKKMKAYREKLVEIGKSGARNAAGALSEMLFEEVALDISDVHILPPQQVQSIYDTPDQATLGIYMELSGEESCDFLLAFEESEGREIAAVMSMEDSPESLEPDVVGEALTELGNIVIGSFINAIADSLSVMLIPTPPNLTMDFFDSIIDRFLIKQSINTDLSIIFVTTFKRMEKTVNGALIVFAGKEFLNNIPS